MVVTALSSINGQFEMTVSQQCIIFSRANLRVGCMASRMRCTRKGHILPYVKLHPYNGRSHHHALQIPWFETPIIFDIRAKPRNVASLTGTKGP